MYFHFSKMHGLGNDFMVVDCITQNVFFSPELIRRLADRHIGVGFDQLLLIEAPYDPDIDFHYRIFNADGSEVEQCGNGARCLARFVYLKKLTNKNTINVSTKKGKIVIKTGANKLITVNMGSPTFEPHKIPFKAKQKEKIYLIRLSDQTLFCGVANIGNPHVVTVVDDLCNTNVDLLGKQLATHERFSEQVNVGFMQILSRSHIKLRVYERGIGETNACGSGACAAVVIGIVQGLLDPNVLVSLPGGDLNISWQGEMQPIFMTGSATHVFDAQLSC